MTEEEKEMRPSLNELKTAAQDEQPQDEEGNELPDWYDPETQEFNLSDMPDELKDLLKEAGISKEDLMPTDGKNELYTSLRSLGLGNSDVETTPDPFDEDANEEKKESEEKDDGLEFDAPQETIEKTPAPKLQKKKTELNEAWKPTDGIPHNMAQLPLADQLRIQREFNAHKRAKEMLRKKLLSIMVKKEKKRKEDSQKIGGAHGQMLEQLKMRARAIKNSAPSE